MTNNASDPHGPKTDALTAAEQDWTITCLHSRRFVVEHVRTAGNRHEFESYDQAVAGRQLLAAQSLLDQSPSPQEGPGADFISGAQNMLWAPIPRRRAVQESGVNITPANFYSSIPLLSDLESTFEVKSEQPIPIYHEVFSQERLSDFMENLLPYASELSGPEDADENAPGGFFWNNSQFTNSDAVAYYCMLRHLKPKRVVEIGSGFSTLVADAALRANGHGEIVAIEPYPRPFLKSVASVKQLIERPIQSINQLEFLKLVNDADVLFIDSTHTVKIGSDCLYIYLHLLPAIKHRIMVHSHDIFLPFGMPISWARDHHIYWTEQYLLYAYLLKNPKASVVYGSTYAEHFLRRTARAFLPEPRPLGGGSLWYELNVEDTQSSS